ASLFPKPDRRLFSPPRSLLYSPGPFPSKNNPRNSNPGHRGYILPTAFEPLPAFPVARRQYLYKRKLVRLLGPGPLFLRALPPFLLSAISLAYPTTPRLLSILSNSLFHLVLSPVLDLVKPPLYPLIPTAVLSFSHKPIYR